MIQIIDVEQNVLTQTTNICSNNRIILLMQCPFARSEGNCVLKMNQRIWCVASEGLASRFQQLYCNRSERNRGCFTSKFQWKQVDRFKIGFSKTTHNRTRYNAASFIRQKDISLLVRSARNNLLQCDFYLSTSLPPCGLPASTIIVVNFIELH